MKKIVLYLIVLLLLIGLGLIYTNSIWFINELKPFTDIFNCCLIGGLGGILYSIRAVYLNYSVKNQWSKQWEIWYFLRPVTSIISGGISLLIIKAGLLVLEADLDEESSYFGVYSLALIAGLNVDRFISKIEDLAKTAWGIEKSRASNQSDNQIKK